jgi:UDP-galactopyranose mutase
LTRTPYILVVGAGFAGATAARSLAEAGFSVKIIDARGHVAGNAYDEWMPQGVRMHKYGPHLFHTNNHAVVQWLGRFTDWLPYEHRVTAQLPGGDLAPLPINRRTLEQVFGRSFQDETAARAYVQQLCVQIPQPKTAYDYLCARIGPQLTDLFFAPYTRKMWGYGLEDMDPSVVKRISISCGEEDRYFPNDRFQALPAQGYTGLIANMLDHDRIELELNQPFDHAMRKDFTHCFLCAPIDVIMGFRWGPLPYRSIRFHHKVIERGTPDVSGTAVINRTDTSPFTRTTFWHRLPGHVRPGDQSIATTEEPCAYEDNDFERYYPIKTSDRRFQLRYQAYAELAAQEKDLTFIGRCGTYQYLDMHQVVSQTLTTVRKKIPELLSRDQNSLGPVFKGTLRAKHTSASGAMLL